MNKIKLGIFVTVGLLIFVAGIFFIGARKNLFSNTIAVEALFNTVEGLQVGSQVRYSGINIGTVESISIKSDSIVLTVLTLESDASQFVKKDAVATITSAGLMGNKIIDISPGSATAKSIEGGDRINTESPTSLEDILGDLKATASSAKTIASNIATISTRIEEGRGLIGNLVSDTTQYQEIESIISSFEMASDNVQNISRDIEVLTSNTRAGQGALGKLMADKETAQKIEILIDSLSVTGDISANVARNIQELSRKLNDEDGMLNKILTDSAFASEINQTVIEVKRASAEIDRTADKVNRSWILNIFGGNKNKKNKQKEENEQ